MHRGARGQEAPPSLEEAEAQLRKAQSYSANEARLLALRAGDTLGAEAMDASLSLLLQNPFHNTAWNVRRDVLEGSADAAALLAELELTAKAIGMSAKVYAVWEHRKYVVRRLLSFCGSPTSPGCPSSTDLLHGEKDFLRKVFAEDAKNFHAWNYRRFLSDSFRERGLLPPSCPPHCFPDDKEFTEEMISRSYDNHSAWHQRQFFFANASEDERIAELNYVAGLLEVDPGCESLVAYFLSLSSAAGLPILRGVIESLVAEAEEEQAALSASTPCSAPVLLPEGTWKLLAVFLLLVQRHSPGDFMREGNRVLGYYDDNDVIAKLSAVFPQLLSGECEECKAHARDNAEGVVEG